LSCLAIEVRNLKVVVYTVLSIEGNSIISFDGESSFPHQPLLAKRATPFSLVKLFHAVAHLNA
jgi:hypothetical protein